MSTTRTNDRWNSGARSLALAAGGTGSLRRPGAAALAAAFAAPAFGQVAGEKVVHGSASFQRQGTLTTITTSNNAIINYSSFNVRANETVRFVQPDALSRVLNRINSSAPTQIDGTVTSNGRVYIVNPAGIFFSKGAMINVGGLYAAAGTITNSDFLRGVDRFVTSPGGRVVNEGTIQAPVIGLVGRSVANFGALSAPEGAVMMVAGETVMMGEFGGHVYAKIEAPAQAGPDGGGAARPGEAPGGQRVRQARFGAGDMYSLAVWNSGTVKADHVRLESDTGAVSVRGTLDASGAGPGERGGAVEVLGPAVAVQGATIDVSGDAGGGRILVGGDLQGGGTERRSARTVVTGGSELLADARTAGDGGRVIVWSDEATRFDGRISARGGAQGGDGGFAEISSKRRLESNFNVDLAAPRGSAGTVLFDPAYISIVGGTGDGSDNTDASTGNLRHSTNGDGSGGSDVAGTIDFGDFGVGNAGDTALNPFIVRESEIENTASNIILRATESISVDTTAAFTGNNLRLSSNQSLTLDVSGTTGSGGVIDLIGSNAANAPSIETQGTGTISILGATGASAQACDITVGKLKTANDKDITISTLNGSISLRDTIDAGKGTLRLNASGTITQVGATSVITAGAIGAAAGSGIALDAATNLVSQSPNPGVFAASLSGAGTVAFRNDGSFSVGTVTSVGPGDVVGINAPLATVKLRSDNGFINQAGPSAAIKADVLGVTTGLALTLNSPSNDANTVALSLSGGAGSLTYVDADGFVIGAVTGVGGVNVTGVNAVAQNASLTAGTGATVTQTDPIAAGTLTLAGAATFTLNGSASNAVANLQTTGVTGVTYQDSTGLVLLDGSSATGDMNIAAATGTLAPAGTITVGGALTLTADAVDFSGLTAFSANGTSGVATVQPFTDSVAVHVRDGTTGFFLAQGDLDKLGGFSSLIVGRDTGTALLTLGGTAAFAQHITLRSGGQGGQVTLLPGAELATSAGKNITVTAGSNDVGDTIHGIFTQSAGAKVKAGAGSITITADEIALATASGADADSIEGTGTILLQPSSPTRALRVGLADDATAFSIDPTEFLTLKDGFSRITIGRANGNASSNIDTITARDPLAFRTPSGGTMTVNALTASSGVALVTGGTLNVSQAFSATNAEIVLSSGSSLTIANGIDAGTGPSANIYIVSTGGDVVQTGGTIRGNSLGVRAAGDITLTQAGNQVSTFAASSTGLNKAVKFLGDGLVSLDIGTVGPDTLGGGTFFASLPGISTNKGDISVSGGPLTITGGMTALDDAVTPTHGLIRLTSSGTVTQNGNGRVFANAMGVVAGGDVSIIHQGTAGNGLANQIGLFAADVSGAAATSGVTYASLDSLYGLIVGGVGADPGLFAGATGITTRLGGDVLVRTVGGIVITEAVTAGAGTVRVQTGGGLFQGGPGIIDAGALGVRTGAEARLNLANTATTIAANTGGGDFLYNLGAGNLQVGTVTQSGALFSNTPGINAGAGTVRLVTPGSLVQGAGAGITAGSLGVRAVNTVILTDSTAGVPNNDVDTVAMSVSGGTQGAAFADADGLVVGSVGALAPFAATDGIIATSDVSVRAGGLLQLNEAVSATSSHDVRLTSTAGITQNTTALKGITARALGVNAGGDAKLLNPDNDAAIFAGRTTAGQLKYLDKTAVDVNSVAADANGFANTDGLTTAGGDALIDAGGAVAFKKNADVGAGSLRIYSTGGVAQDAATTVKAAELGVIATGPVDFSQSGNIIGTVAGTNADPGSVFAVTSAGPLKVKTINADFDSANFPATSGILTTNGLVSLKSTGASGAMNIEEVIQSGTGGVLLDASGLVTLAQAVRADTVSGFVRITTTGGVTQTAADITAAILGVRAGGDVKLDSGTGPGLPLNNVSLFAANSGGNVTFLDIGGFSIGQVGLLGAFAQTSGITAAGTARLQATGPGGIAQNASSPISATALGVISGGAATLDDPANSFGTVAVRATAVTINNSVGPLHVGSVVGLGNVQSVSGVTSTGGGGTTTISSAGDLVLDTPVDAGGSGTLVLSSGGALSQTEATSSVTADQLRATASSGISLDSTTNDVNTFAARTTNGGVEMQDADDLQIVAVPSSSLIGVQGSGQIKLRAGAGGIGDLTFGSNVIVRGADITLIAGDGAGGGTTSKIDARNPAGGPPLFQNATGSAAPASFTFEQDPSITADSSPTANPPASTQFPGGNVSTNYRLQSDDGNILAAAGVFSPTTNLTLAVTPNTGAKVQLAPGLVVKSLTIIGASNVQSVTSADKIEFQSDVTFDATDTFLEGDEINFFGKVSAANDGQTLTLRPRTTNRTIQVGFGTATDGQVDPEGPSGTRLDLTAFEINNFALGTKRFAKVIIGDDPLVIPTSPLSPFTPLTGLLEVVGPVTFVQPTTFGMRGTGSRIEIKGRVTMTGATPGAAPLFVKGTGTTMLLAEDILTNGQAVDIQDSVLVSGARTISTTQAAAAGANVTLQGPTDGYSADAGIADSLSIAAGTGNVALTNAVGGGTLNGGRVLDALTVTGASVALPAVTTTGAQSYTGATTLNGSLTGTTAGTITFNSPVTLAAPTITVKTAGAAGDIADFKSTVDGASDLTIDAGTAGAARFAASVGATTPLTKLTVQGPTVITAPVTLTTATGASSSVALLGSVTGAGQTLTIASPLLRLGGNVSLGSLVVGSSGANTATQLTADPISITTTAPEGVAFNGTLDSDPSLTGAAAPDLTVATGAGAATFGGPVGQATPLGSLTVTGNSIALGSVRTLGAQAYTGLAGVTLGGNLTSTSAGSIAVSGPWTLGPSGVTVQTAGASGDDITFANDSAAGSAGRSLTTSAGSGAVTFGGDAGIAGSELGALTVSGGSISLRNVRTTSSQTYTGSTTLGGDASSTGAAPITFNGPLTLSGTSRSVSTAGGAILFSGAVNGASALLVNAGAAGITFTSFVGAGQPLTSLSATGGQISSGPGVTTSGAQTYTGATVLQGNLTAAGPGAITVNGPVTLSTSGGAPVRVTTAGASATDSITLNGTVDGGPALVLNAGPQGNATITGAVGGSIDPASLTATARFITLSKVETTGDQVYHGTTSITDSVTASRLFFDGSTVLGNASAESTYTGAQGVRFIGDLWLAGDTAVNGGNGQIYFHGRVETAQTSTAHPTPTGVAAPGPRSLRLTSTLSPTLISTGDPHANDASTFTAYVNAPYLFNDLVGGDYQNPGIDPSVSGQIASMLRTLTFSDAAAAPSVASIVLTRRLFNFPQDDSTAQTNTGTPSTNVDKWFLGTNPSLRLGGFTIPNAAPYNLVRTVTRGGTTKTESYIERTDPNVTTRFSTTGGFDMGKNNKALAVGNLFVYIDAGNAVLGDMASLADINVLIGEVERSPAGSATSRTITINQRPGGSVTTNQFQTGSGAVSVNDLGVDFIALTKTNFSVVPSVTGGGIAIFSSPEGTEEDTFRVRDVNQFPSGSTKGKDNAALQRSVFKNANVDKNLLFPADGDKANQGDIFSNLTIYGMGLDFPAEGPPGGGGVASALAGALPNTQSAAVQTTVTLGANVLEDLLQLGFNVKDPRSEKYAADYLRQRALSLSGRSEFNDVPPYAKPDPSANQEDYRVSVDRLSLQSIKPVLASYRDLVGESAGRAEQKRKIQKVINDAWDKYAEGVDAAGGTPDGLGFRRFVDTTESEKAAKEYLDRLGELLRQIDRLPLTPAELSRPKQQTLTDFSDSITWQQLEEAALGVRTTRTDSSVALAAGSDAR